MILVGHSYGGAVISEAGTHEKVAALVYITAFVPDAGESVNTLLGSFPADGPHPPILPPQNGLLFLDKEQFREAGGEELVLVPCLNDDPQWARALSALCERAPLAL